MAQSSKCLNDNTLYKYIDNQLSEKERARVDRHLNECPECLASLTSLIKLATEPVNDEEKKILEHIEQVPVDERMEEVLGHKSMVINNSIDSKQIIENSKITNPIKKLLQIFKRPSIDFRPVYALGLILVITLGSFGIRYFRTDYQVIIAERLLEKYFHTSRNALRLSGDYSPSFYGDLMGGETDSSYVDKALKKIRNAQNLGAQSSQLFKIKSHILIIHNEYAKADSLLFAQKEGDLSSTLNDLAVSSYEQENTTKAIEYLERSLSSDPTYTPALYNLGLIYQTQDDRTQALAYFEKCLTNESNSRWRSLIQERIAEIKKGI